MTCVPGEHTRRVIEAQQRGRGGGGGGDGASTAVVSRVRVHLLVSPQLQEWERGTFSALCAMSTTLISLMGWDQQ